MGLLCGNQMIDRNPLLRYTPLSAPEHAHAETQMKSAAVLDFIDSGMDIVQIGLYAFHSEVLCFLLTEIPLTSGIIAQVMEVEKNVMEAEIRRVKLELKQSMEMYNSVCKEARELQHLHTLKALKLDEVELAEEAAEALAEPRQL
ncbi:hypothetical protein DKX38_003899 [Salix brachista]|uniref:Uncharacterized protein n=1 Tax=Salix brachista TaxID=2182728 RepID=A0A5N5N8W0_9ROSI|nr:hypothetical protein DKX38_003899 [Salix brachista]